MIADFLHRNPRLLLLIIGVICVAGLSSQYVLPRMEDPLLGKRVAVISTAYPGADPGRVETMISQPLEDSLDDISEIQEIRSTSRAGMSTVVVELRDDVTDVEPIWSRVRDRLADVAPTLPPQAIAPEFERLELKAYASILAIAWNGSEEPNLPIMSRLAKDLKSSLENVAGTQQVKIYGSPGEEVLVEIDPRLLAPLDLTVGAVAHQIEESNVQQPAGLLRVGDAELLLDVDEQVDSIVRLGETRIVYGDRGQTTSLTDIASIRKATVDPPASLALVNGNRSIVLAAFVRDDTRIDHWNDRIQPVLESFERQLPPGLSLEVVLEQNRYVEQRMNKLLWSLLAGTCAVVLVVYLMMGWRSTIVVGLALPLSAMIVLTGMRLLGIPIHQMSIMGLIIALGLLIDNAIVIVEEVRKRLWAGMSRRQAIREGVGHLAMPLFGSTLTTTLAFAPIVLLPGPPGEFVGAVAISVILAINASFLLAMSIVPALTGLLHVDSEQRSWHSYGASFPKLKRLYQGSILAVLHVPVLGVLIGAALPILGLLLARDLSEQFFPPSERNQLQVELELSAGSSLKETTAMAQSIRSAALDYSQVDRLHWFVGESAPTFFYNVMPRRRGAPFYAQAIVDLEPGADPIEVARELQAGLAERFAAARVLVRQLEQGPPFDAPIEVRLRGPDLSVLRELGTQVRLSLSQSRNVIATRADVSETLPKMALQVDEQRTRITGLSYAEIARQLYTDLEGAPAGELTRADEELPIRVRLANRNTIDLEALATLGIRPTVRAPSRPGTNESSRMNPPLDALADIELSSEIAAITRLEGERVNEVKAYVTAGTLPSEALDDFMSRLDESGFVLPPGYTMEFGGESAKRDSAVGDLLANAMVLLALILLVLVAAFRSFRIAAIIASVGALSIGLGPGALWFFGYPFGFMAIVGAMGLVGIAINDAIVVAAGITSDPAAKAGDRDAICRVVTGCTRHVVATSLTTIGGFTPLILAGGRFWVPLAITIAGGVGGATLLALYFVPAAYILLMTRQQRVSSEPTIIRSVPRPQPNHIAEQHSLSRADNVDA